MESQDKTITVKMVDSAFEVLAFLLMKRKKEVRYIGIYQYHAHDLLESSADRGSQKKSHDISTATSIFEKYWGTKVKITNTNRIGQRKDSHSKRPKLTKVSVELEHEKTMILPNYTKLRVRDNPEHIQNA